MCIWLITLVLLSAATWTYELRGKPGGTSITFPIGPGRQVTANLWKPGPGYAESDYNRGALIARRGPLTIMLWYQVRGSAGIVRLGSLQFAVWPLVLNTAAIGVLMGWLRLRQAHRRARTSRKPHR
jgi:hypothetical protein